jgi:hypothetical protein
MMLHMLEQGYQILSRSLSSLCVLNGTRDQQNRAVYNSNLTGQESH